MRAPLAAAALIFAAGCGCRGAPVAVERNVNEFWNDGVFLHPGARKAGEPRLMRFQYQDEGSRFFGRPTPPAARPQPPAAARPQPPTAAGGGGGPPPTGSLPRFFAELRRVLLQRGDEGRSPYFPLVGLIDENMLEVRMNKFVHRRNFVAAHALREAHQQRVVAALQGALFRSPNLEVPEVFPRAQLWLVALTAAAAAAWLAGLLWLGLYNSTALHIDVCELIPLPLGRSLDRCFTLFSTRLLKYSTGGYAKALPDDAGAGGGVQLDFRSKSALRLKALTLTILSSAVIAVLVSVGLVPRALALVVTFTLATLARALQGWNLTEAQAQNLLLNFVRQDVARQAFSDSQVRHLGVNFGAASLQRRGMMDATVEKFNRNTALAEVLPREKYLLIVGAAGSTIWLIILAVTAHAYCELDFQEFFASGRSLQFVVSRPALATLLLLAVNVILFRNAFDGVKPMLLLIAALAQQRATTEYFLQHSPLVTPYAYSGRYSISPPADGLFRWVGARRVLARHLANKLRVVQGPADFLVMAYALYTAVAVVFSARGALAAAASGAGAHACVFGSPRAQTLLLAAGVGFGAVAAGTVYQAERFSRSAQDRSATLFWDAWAALDASHGTESKLAFRPAAANARYGDVAAVGRVCGVPVSRYHTFLFAVGLSWLWGAVFWNSSACWLAQGEAPLATPA